MSTTYTTKAIILKTVQYGETSLIVTALTELFGVQTYLVKGVRTGTKTQAAKAVYFQPAAILEMVVYHQPLKQMNFVKEFKWGFLYKNIYQQVVKNSIALYCIELLQKCTRQPEDNPELFYFAEDVLVNLDSCPIQQTANFPLFVAVHLPAVLGFQIIDNFSTKENILDLQEGKFVAAPAQHEQVVPAPNSSVISKLLKVQHPNELDTISLNGTTRRELLHHLEIFFQLHIAEFGKIKSLPILQEILS